MQNPVAVRNIKSAIKQSDALSKEPAVGADSKSIYYGFFMVPDFPLLAFSSAIEPLRMANRLSNQVLYQWSLFSIDDAAVMASNGMYFAPTATVNNAENVDTLFVISGIDAHRYCDQALLNWLRKLSRRGITLGALSIASVILAKAGLLDGYRCTIHWENLDSFMEEFPALKVSPELFEIDRKRITCSGGTAALDMMLYLIRSHHGSELAAAVAEQCIHPQIRDAHERQRMTLRTRLNIAHPKLLQVLDIMQAHLEEPIDCRELANQIGLTLRQLERLFQQYLHTTPKRYYLELRLQQARNFLQQTTLPVSAIAHACGFSSASYFANCYRQHFTKTPRQERS